MSKESTPEIHEEEIRKSLQKKCEDKAVGPRDGVSTGRLEAGGPEVLKLLTRLCNQALKERRIPRDWTLAEIVPLHKKRDLTDI